MKKHHHLVDITGISMYIYNIYDFYIHVMLYSIDVYS